MTRLRSVSYAYDLNGNAVNKNDATGITTYAWDFGTDCFCRNASRSTRDIS